MAKTVRLDEDALQGRLAAQHGVISRAQAAACGMTPGTLRHRVRPGGPWRTLLPGVYLANTGTPGRAQLDMAALLHAGRGGVISGLAALSRHGVRTPRTDVELTAGPVRGSALLRHALAEVTAGARSVAEGDFLLLIKRARLPEPMLNARLFAGETFIAAPDCWWPRAGLAAEVDSREWHLSPGDWARTLARHRRMTGYGITVLHVTPGQIVRDPKGVVGDLAAALAACRGRPTLPITARPAR